VADHPDDAAPGEPARGEILPPAPQCECSQGVGRAPRARRRHRARTADAGRCHWPTRCRRSPTTLGKPGDLAGLRAAGRCFSWPSPGAFRRSELVGIDVAHLRFETESLIVYTPRSKRDQTGAAGRMSPCHACRAPRPARSARWRHGCGGRGPVFRRISPRPKRSRGG
jgi:hypothetical protein